jgi:superfamily II DNA or RNA helicase
MSELIIEKLDDVNLKVRCDRGTAKELSDFFTFKVPGYKFMPQYRNKMWDGTIKLYNIYSQTIYFGLLNYVCKFAEDRNYTLKIDNPQDFEKNNYITHRNIRKFIDDRLQPIAAGELIKAHEHQINAVHHAINNDRCLLLSPTASGKSLIIYSLVRYYLNKIPKEKKILVVVPTTSLVSQMYSDFSEYAQIDESFDCEEYLHVVFAGREKSCKSCRVLISTWQSIYKLPKEYFQQYHVVFGDECHLFKSKSLTTLMTKLTDCPYRVGTTGTLDGTQTHKLVIEGLFGPVYDVVTTKELMDKNLLAQLKIDAILLKYTDIDKKEIKRAKYHDEMKWLIRNKKRNEFITNMSINIKGNTLILFQFVEEHGKILYNMVKDEVADTDRQVFFVHGGTDVDDREKIRHIVEENNDCIIVASYGTFSTGVSIRKLHNIIFASPSKSRIRVLQSIGRQLRKSNSKEIAKLYDIGDDLSWKSYKNHTLRHFTERIKIYDAEKFNYNPIIVKL